MRLLVFGIHPDDIELGCGGTVAAHVKAGHDVVLADLTQGEASSNGTPEDRAREAAAAAGILGCKERVSVGLPDAGIRSEHPDQQRLVVEVIRRVRPEIVLVPNANDPHPDHRSGGVLVERALYLAGIHGYAAEGEAWKVRIALMYSGRREVKPDIVVDVSQVYDIKRRAIHAHVTQFGASAGSKPTPLNAPGFLSVVEARDRTHGHFIGVEYGEALETLEPLPIPDLGLLGRGWGRS